MFNLGFRAHDFGSFSSVEELGKNINSFFSHSSIQLALKKVVPASRDWREWDEDYINSIRETLLSYGVNISIIGCYINPVHPDEEKRKSELERFKKSLSLWRAFGTKIVATETGTQNPNGGYSPLTGEKKYLELFYSSLSEMVNEAEKYGAYCTIEAVNHTHTMGSLERMARMLERFPSSSLKVLLDPINLVPYTGIKEKDGIELYTPTKEAQKAFYSPILDTYKEKLIAIHVKDYILSEEGTKIGTLPALTGVFDWQGFIQEMKRRGYNIFWSLENMKPETVKDTVEKLNRMWDNA